jgi:hypothetical protein
MLEMSVRRLPAVKGKGDCHALVGRPLVERAETIGKRLLEIERSRADLGKGLTC